MSIVIDHAPIRWQPRAEAVIQPWTRPGFARAVSRGLMGRCPCCGRGALFQGWLRPVPHCAQCQAPLGAARADDAPPYVVIFVVAHFIIGVQVLGDTWMGLSLAAEAAIFLPLTLALCLGLLRPVKGAVVGLIMQLGLADETVAQP